MTTWEDELHDIGLTQDWRVRNGSLVPPLVDIASNMQGRTIYAEIAKCVLSKHLDVIQCMGARSISLDRQDMLLAELALIMAIEHPDVESTY